MAEGGVDGRSRRDGRRSLWRGPVLALLAAVLVVTGLPAEAQAPRGPGTAEVPVVVDPEGRVFADRTLLPAPGEVPTGATTRSGRTEPVSSSRSTRSLGATSCDCSIGSTGRSRRAPAQRTSTTGVTSAAQTCAPL